MKDNTVAFSSADKGRWAAVAVTDDETAVALTTFKAGELYQYGNTVLPENGTPTFSGTYLVGQDQGNRQSPDHQYRRISNRNYL